MPVIVLLRHGVSSANTAGILAGRAPGVSLTEEGAVALEANLGLLPRRRFSRLLHSPLQRCVQTAEIAQRSRSSTPSASTGTSSSSTTGTGRDER
jgi:broad specificity phosphatase PhoE